MSYCLSTCGTPPVVFKYPLLESKQKKTPKMSNDGLQFPRISRLHCTFVWYPSMKKKKNQKCIFNMNIFFFFSPHEMLYRFSLLSSMCTRPCVSNLIACNQTNEWPVSQKYDSLITSSSYFHLTSHIFERIWFSQAGVSVHCYQRVLGLRWEKKKKKCFAWMFLEK